MKYTKKAYLTMTPPQTGGAESNNMKQLVNVMINREEESKTPYTNQLLRLKQELNDLLQDATIPPDQKLQIMSEKFRTYRSFLKKAQEQRRQGRVVVPPTIAPQSTSPAVPPATPVPKRLTTTSPDSGYVASAVLPPTPPSSTPRRVPTTPMSKNRRKLQQRLQGLKTNLARLREEEAAANGAAVAATSPSPPMTRHRRRRKQQQQQGQGHPLVWTPVRFTRCS